MQSDLKPKHIYWFAYFDESCPSVRYRGKYLLAYLAKTEQIRYDLVVPSYQTGQIFRFLKVYFSALLFRKRDSVIVVQKLYTQGIYAKALKFLLRFQRKHTLYDLDDAEYLRHSPESIEFFLSHVEQVVVGSAALREYALQFNPNVEVLSSPLIAHSCQQRAGKTPLKIGWIGYFNNHKENLASLVFPALKAFKVPIVLELLGVDRPAQRQQILDEFAAFPHIQLQMPEDLNWQDEHSIYARIATWHLGLAPLLDQEFFRAKSAFKLKQVKSCGVPVFASPVGENVHFLKEGQDGFFFQDAGELQILLQRHQEKLLQKGFKVADSQAGFSMPEYAKSFLGLFE